MVLIEGLLGKGAYACKTELIRYIYKKRNIESRKLYLLKFSNLSAATTNALFFSFWEENLQNKDKKEQC